MGPDPTAVPAEGHDRALPEIDADGTRAAMADLMAGPVVYLPVRHHSPTCALHVRTVVEQRQPFAVLVEGPPSFDAHLDLLLAPDARFPLAIYAHASFDGGPAGVSDVAEIDEVRADPEPSRHASYFPLCDYSPELAALRAGRSLGAEVGFVDLEYHDAVRAGVTSVAGHADEHHFAFSDVLAETASRLGCRDHNELWDQMVEADDGSDHDVFAAVLAYASIARAGSNDEALERDGTGPRERAMARGVVEALDRRAASGGDGPIVVVTGAFHTVALPALVGRLLAGEAVGPPTDACTGSESPPLGDLLDHGSGLIRYSFDRLDALAGYAAGMPSPRWYQQVWEQLNGSSDEDGAADPAASLIAAVAADLRDAQGTGVPSLPSIVDAMTAAEQLRRLRGRARISRLDALDAMVSCFTKGEDAAHTPLRLIAARAMTGSDLGRLPANAPRAPLARDLDRLIAELGLPGDTTEEKQVHLDVYRSERDRQRSRFLHGLVSIGVPYGRCITPLRFSRAAGRDVVRERWAVRASAALDTAATEASVWGSSVAEAVAARTAAELADVLAGRPSSAELMRLIAAAAQRGVPDVVTRGLDAVRDRVAVDPSLPSVVTALTEADLLHSAREPLGGGSLRELPALAEQLYLRACQLGARLPEASADEHDDMVTALEELHRSLAAGTWPELDADLYWSLLASLRVRVPAGMLRGAVAGLEWRGGRIADDDLIGTMVGHLGSSADPALGATFIAGLVRVARQALWDVDGVAEALTNAIADLDEEAFLRRLPGLRSAFAELTPGQTDRLAERVRALTGERAHVRVFGIEAGEVLVNARRSEAAVCELADDGLAHWIEVAAGGSGGEAP